jgi:hypothetical protein
VFDRMIHRHDVMHIITFCKALAWDLRYWAGGQQVAASTRRRPFSVPELQQQAIMGDYIVLLE